MYATATNLAFRRTAWTGYDTALTQGGDELDQLRRLRRRRQIKFDRSNVVTTSARRLRRGLFYTIVITLFYYYVLGYVINRLFSRQIVSTAPSVGTQQGRARSRWRDRLAAPVGLLLLLVIVAPHNDAVTDTIRALTTMSRASR